MTTALWTGLTLGSVYTLIALGYNIVFVTTGVFNFAQAQLLILGTFVAYWTSVTLGWPALPAIVICVLICTVTSVLEERLAIRPLAGKGFHGELVTTVGVTVVIEGVILKIWGPDPLRVPFFGWNSTWRLGDVAILPVEVLIIGVAVGASLGTYLWSRFSMVGLGSRATIEDRDAAMLRGVNVRRLSIGAFVVAGALAGLLGPIVGPKTFAVASLGFVLALKGFVALALGGFGSHVGALVGGVLLGLVEALAGRQLGADYQNVIVFAVLLVVLLARPTGLFGIRTERVV